MREYLFRGKRLDNGEWVHGKLTGIKLVPEISTIEPKGIIGPFSFMVDPETIGQFTGQKDYRNKTKIFEGDKVIMHQTQMGSGIPQDFEGVVKFINGHWAVDSGKDWYSLYQELGWWKVTGNIHD